MFSRADRDLPNEELVLFFYGEARHPERIRRRLASSPAARERYEELCRILEAVGGLAVPEPPEDYGAQLWSRLGPRLGERQPGLGERMAGFLRGMRPRRLAMAGAVVGLLVVAFVAGRYWPGATTPVAAPGERIVLTAVGRHLERSQRLLVELVNSDGRAVDLTAERDRARELLGANRIYRRASERSGQDAVAALLDELERLLLDLAHAPEAISSPEPEEIRGRVDEILFKVQVLGARVRRQHPAQPPTRPPRNGGNEVWETS